MNRTAFVLLLALAMPALADPFTLQPGFTKLPTPPPGTDATVLTSPKGLELVLAPPRVACTDDRMLLCVAAPACVGTPPNPPPLIADAFVVLGKLTTAQNRWGTKVNPIDATRLARIKAAADLFQWLVAGGCYEPGDVAIPACSDVGEVAPGAAIRTRLQALKDATPQLLELPAMYLRSLSDAELSHLLSGALAAARCRSDRAAGPRDPYTVPAAQVRAWLLDVVGDGASPELRALRPLVEHLPADVLRWLWLRAVELKRGLPVRP